MNEDGHCVPTERNQYMAKVFTHITFLRNEKSPHQQINKSSHHRINKSPHHQIITSKSPLSPYKLSSFDKFFQYRGLNQLKI